MSLKPLLLFLLSVECICSLGASNSAAKLAPSMQSSSLVAFMINIIDIIYIDIYIGICIYIGIYIYIYLYSYIYVYISISDTGVRGFLRSR